MEFMPSAGDAEFADSLPVFIWSADATGAVTSHNAPLLGFLGLTPARLDSTTWFDRIHDEDREPVAVAWAGSVATAAAFTCEMRVRASDGTYRWCAARAVRSLASSGSSERWMGALMDIHDRIMFERSGRAADEAFYVAVETMPTPLGVYKAVRDSAGAIVDFRIAYVNDAACRANRMTREAQVGRLLNEVLPGHRQSALFAEYCRLVETGSRLSSDSVSFTDTYGGAEPETRVFHIHADRIEDGFVAVWRDVTEEHTREERCRRQAATLTAVIESSPVAIFAKDLQGRYILANPVMAAVFGAQPGDIVGRTDRELVGPVVAGTFEESDRLALNDRATVTREESVIGQDGCERVFLVAKRPVVSLNDVLGVCGVAVDITARVRATSELEVAKTRLALALRAGQLGVWEWRLADGTVQWSPEAFTILGLQPDARTRLLDDLLAIVNESDRDAMWHQIEAALQTGTEFDAEFRVVAGGESRWVRNKGLARRDATGLVVGMIGIVQDISELKARELELQRSHAEGHARAEELQLLLDAAPAAIWITRDPDCQTITGSRFAAELLRMQPGDNLSKSAVAGAPEHFTVRVAGRVLAPDELPMQRAARGEQVRNFEEEVVFDDGTTLTLFGSALPLMDPGGRARGAISAFVDVTALKQAEAGTREARAAAEEANRLKDQFLATLSHELRTPLNAIIGYVSMLRGGVLSEDRRENALAIVERNAGTQLRLVEELLDISRITAGTLRLDAGRVPVEPLVNNAVDAIRPAASEKGIVLTVLVPDDAPDVVGDRIRLQQVLWNLLNNAIKFTSRTGHIEVKVTREADTVVMTVRDTGDGIAPDFLPIIFEPFRQETRRADRIHSGLGLGLTIAKHLVERHGGAIGGASDGVGKGSTFWIRLPSAPS